MGGNIKYNDTRNECYKKRFVMSATLKRCFSFATGNMMKSMLSERLLTTVISHVCDLFFQ